MDCSRAAFIARSVLRATKFNRTCHHESLAPTLRDKYHPKLGNRDIVGYGWNGTPSYMDRIEYPCPPVRFGENTQEVLALRQKEKGDWKTMSLDEKKKLYRASFRQTFAEMNVSTGDWKVIAAIFFFGLSITGWLAIGLKKIILPEMPHTITREWQEKQLELMIKQRQGAVTGIGSHFDYEKNAWK